MYVIVLAIIAAVVAGVLIANAVFSPTPRRRRMPPGGEDAPPSEAPVPAHPVGPRGSPGDEELPPFEALAEPWAPEPSPHPPYPGERSSSRRADEGPDPADADPRDDPGGGHD